MAGQDPFAVPERPTSYGGAPGADRGNQYETPTQAIVAAARRTATVTDELGRRITVRYITGRDRMLLFKVLGAELVKNEYYLGYATLAWAVTAIDNGSGEDPRVPPMVKTSEIEFLVDRLGDAGLEAVGRAYKENFADLVPGVDIDAAKN